MPPAAPANTRMRRSRGVSFKVVARNRPKTCADLGDGTFFTGGAAAADGDGRGHDLYQGDPLANQAALSMKGLDHGIGAVPFGFWGDGIDQHPRYQAAQGRNDQKQPGAGHPQEGHRRRPGQRFCIARG